MTLADLINTLETRAALPASRVKDMKTSLKYLAAALGHGGPEQCPVDTCWDPATWAPALEAHFATLETQGRTISVVTRRNTRNNLRTLLRQAEAHGLLASPLPPRLLTPEIRRQVFLRQQAATNPYPATYCDPSTRRYTLPRVQWPPDIQTGWRDYQARCGFRIRERSFQSYEEWMTSYLGYLTNICGRTPTWDDVFDTAQLAAFVRWHAARLGRSSSAYARQVVILCAAIAKVIAHPHARALADMRNTLKPPTPLHIKRVHWVSLATLEAVADACLTKGRRPYVSDHRTQHPGARRAAHFQCGVLLKVLVRIPLRQRNLREMRLGTNLYQDQAGHWHLHFTGSELKVGERQGRTNTYHVDLTDYCPDLLPVLEEFLQIYRPRLPGALASPLCFLTQRGNPFRAADLHTELAYIVARHTGQRFYPHLIRTIWATEYLEATQDFTTAAVMLGDTLGVVMKTYYDVVNKDHHAKAKTFLGTALHAG